MYVSIDQDHMLYYILYIVLHQTNNKESSITH